MSLRPSELEPLAAELTRELREAVVQKVAAPTSSRVYLELRVPGRTVTLLACAEPKVARVSAVEARPPNPPTPPGWQSVLRRELTGARLQDAEALPARRTLLLHFSREGRPLTVVLELAQVPTLLLCNADARVLALSSPARDGLRVGQPWAPVPESGGEGGGAPSRLQGDRVFLRLAHAAEALLGAVEQRAWQDARRAPLLARRKRLLRTMEKVRLESERGTLATRYRQEGELLRHQLHLVRRGDRVARLTDYAEDGTVREVEVPLDPARTPQQEVEWRFHQYRRLTRGAEMARARLATLATELQALDAELRRLEAEPPAVPSPAQRPRRAPEPASLPYREYRGHGGQRIWVGRGAQHNDRLTFQVARPFHLWLHVRGVPGAHVVVPLDKGALLSPEVLIDAAHLAVHHSDARGEPRAEVSYTPIKFVHKPKDAGPGAVTYTREKTLVVRLEADRLARLLSTFET
jgi:predicted ribosome quality control (RQC) complex YloA/Tae2 family protein